MTFSGQKFFNDMYKIYNIIHRFKLFASNFTFLLLNYRKESEKKSIFSTVGTTYV